MHYQELELGHNLQAAVAVLAVAPAIVLVVGLVAGLISAVPVGLAFLYALLGFQDPWWTHFQQWHEWINSNVWRR